MKKTYLGCSIVIIMILLSGFTYTEASSTDTSKINEIKQKITDMKLKATEEKGQAKAKLTSTSADPKNSKLENKSEAEVRIGKKLDAQKLKVADVFEKAIKNLKDLILRIESRMAKMESSNINVSAPRSLLETAKTKLTLAETELVNLENLLVQDVPTSTSTKYAQRKTMLQNIKTQSEKTKTAIKNAHKSVVEVVVSLKLGQLKENDHASTTEAGSTSTNN
jgi:hypothetical protein